jgi:hypothetical protein
MKIRDRIKELRRVPAKELLPNPHNWRTHPKAQQDALRGMLAEIGFADALLARETPNGLLLIDGHLRAEIAPDSEIPVLVLDLTEAEADQLLATLDPLAGLAEMDAGKLDALMQSVKWSSDELAATLKPLWDLPEKSKSADTSPRLGDLEYRVIVKCADEAAQGELYERLTQEGFECQLLIS